MEVLGRQILLRQLWIARTTQQFIDKHFWKIENHCMAEMKGDDETVFKSPVSDGK